MTGKYRVWDNESKCWFKNTWKKQFIINTEGKLWYIEWDGQHNIINSNLNEINNNYEKFLCSDLPDENENEIYDGDIIETASGHIGRVFMRLGCWFVTLEKELGYYPACDIKIIGNVKENPELL